ncbi:TetR/AcrR family transcriptional regulator [Sphingomonas sp. LR61]|uniref:TetR/AcrR family transcriptional regulator n=1 Tax=Sphingomonas sp. LR61 TaxID=3050234 RepID=UPI002FE3E7EA
MTSNDGIGTRGPYAKGVQRRREILDQTLDVVASRGIDGTSLRAIGDAIGVSHAALKHYFSSREALLVEVLRERDAASDRALGDTAGVFTRLAFVADRNVSEPALVTLYTTLLGASVESGNETAREFFAARFDEARGTWSPSCTTSSWRRGGTRTPTSSRWRRSSSRRSTGCRCSGCWTGTWTSRGRCGCWSGCCRGLSGGRGSTRNDTGSTLNDTGSTRNDVPVVARQRGRRSESTNDP